MTDFGYDSSTHVRGAETELNDKLREDNKRIIEALEKRQWVDKHPFIYGLAMALAGGIFGAISTRLIESIFR